MLATLDPALDELTRPDTICTGAVAEADATAAQSSDGTIDIASSSVSWTDSVAEVCGLPPFFGPS